MSSHLLRSDLIPILSGYLILMAALAIGLLVLRRRSRAGLPITREPGRHNRGWRGLLWHMVTDAAGGYVLLMAVVLLYYYGVAQVGSHFLASAFSGSALLIGIVLPVFAAASWLTRRGGRVARRSGRGRRSGQG